MTNIEQRLTEFVAYCHQHLKGDEKGEAQIFLDRLFSALGYADGIKGAEATTEQRIRITLHDERTTTRFADLVIPGRVLIEMKKRGEDLQRHFPQAMNYWQNLVPAPQYVILCNFDEFWVYDMHYQPSAPRGRLHLAQLAESWGALAWLLPVPQAPVFSRETDLIELTKGAAGILSQVFNLLSAPRPTSQTIEPEVALRFILQSMVALFAEDIGLLPRYTFTRVIEDCREGKAASYDLFTLLFTFMNMPGKKLAGRFHEVDYFNGGLFQTINPIVLAPNELRLLREAADFKWSHMRPEIFGTIFEQSISAKERHAAGIHYTSEVDIRRIVYPVIERPWTERIDAATSAEALLALHAELCRYKVLDPACGSGNFLYIAYRVMKALERRIIDRVTLLTGSAPILTQTVSTRQFYGLDVKPFAVELAKVTLMIAKKMAVDELHTDEKPLPLDNLDANIRCEDALFADWGEPDAIIGNPPYLGAKRMKVEHKPEYINHVRAAFPEVPGNADYCVYWFRKAHDVLREGGRAGLVGTNSIRQNNSRIGGLDYIVANGGTLYEAVPSTPWSGEAVVHISIASWSKGDAPYTPRIWVETNDPAEPLRALDVPFISSSLSVQTDVNSAKELNCNTEPKQVFQGQTLGHKGFLLTTDEVQRIIAADKTSEQVIFAFMTGDDLLSEPHAQPARWVIDFEGRALHQARAFKPAFQRLEKTVLPDLEAKARAENERNEAMRAQDPRAKVNRHHQGALDHWWSHFYDRTDLRDAIQNLKRYIICSRISKRPVFDFVSTRIKISDKVQAFVFEDDYTFGILQSNLHWQWWQNRGATLKSDPAYTPHSIFDTLPFPQNPTAKQVKAIADAARTLHEYRRKIMAENPAYTLRIQYRDLETSNKDLKKLHTALDNAVLAAYGFDGGDVLAQLLALNGVVADRIAQGQPVTAPGIPASYPTPTDLISAGCIQPPALW
jgi:hypothetical protein